MKVIRAALRFVVRWSPIGWLLYLGVPGVLWRFSESNLANNSSIGFSLGMLAWAYVSIYELEDKVKALESRR